jgi:hypothetical protein
MIFLFLFVVFIFSCKGQKESFFNNELKIQPFSLPETSNQSRIFTYTLFTSLPNYSFNSSTINHLNYSLPKGAIFCRMEDALHKHFNLWIKFRMGDDDRYSN